MKKIKFLARSIVLLAAINSVDVNGEYYIVQPGDDLSRIAQSMRHKSRLSLSQEQVMLTIFKFNPDVFVDGNVDRIIPSKRIYVPDNVAEFVQFSKNESRQRLRDRNYLHELYASASQLKLTGASDRTNVAGNNIQDFTQVLQILDNHQQNIDILKIENTHLSKSFKLLERALGRIVIVQGLLTNDVVKVKSKLFNTSSNAVAPVIPENASVAGKTLALGDTAPVTLPKIQENSAKLEVGDAKPIKTTDQIALNDRGSDTHADANSEDISHNENSTSNANLPNAGESPALAAAVKPDQDEDFWLDTAMIAAILLPLLLLLLWIIDFRQIRSKLSPTKATADVGVSPKLSMIEKFVAGTDNSRYAANVATLDTARNDSKPVKIKAEKPIKDNGLVERITELGGVLELLDMCLLCGDYQQAHVVTLKGLVDHQSSPVLTKKLAFIERRLAKY